MNRQEKAAVVESLREGFTKSQASFLVGFKGLSVEQMQILRKNLRAKGGNLRVAKARLMKRAATDLPEAEAMLPYFKEQVGVVFAPDGPAAIAKVLSDFAKENEAMSIVVGCLESVLLDQDAVKRIASLPSREVLLAQVCGTLKAPITGLACALNMLQLKLLWTLKQIEQQKQ